MEVRMANPFVHVELHTKDLSKARQFYQSLFGWELKDVPMPGGAGNYTTIGVGEGVGGGMMADSSAPPHWLAYVGVDDVRAKTTQAKALGATVLQDILEVGDFGVMSVIRDPSGAVIALWQGKGQRLAQRIKADDARGAGMARSRSSRSSPLAVSPVVPALFARYFPVLPYIPVTDAFASVFAFTTNPTTGACAPLGSSSLSTFNA